MLRSKRNLETTTHFALNPSFPPSPKPFRTSLFRGTSRAGIEGTRDQKCQHPTGQVISAGLAPSLEQPCQHRGIWCPRKSLQGLPRPGTAPMTPLCSGSEMGPQVRDVVRSLSLWLRGERTKKETVTPDCRALDINHSVSGKLGVMRYHPWRITPHPRQGLEPQI